MVTQDTARGSNWHKWDLHVHTPASLVQRYNSSDDPWSQFLDELEALPAEFAVLGINDYWFLDGYRRVLEERAKGRLANIKTVFPVVELRLDQFGGSGTKLSRANLHVIFDPNLTPEVIQGQFLNAMSAKFRLSDTGHEWSGVVDRDSLEELGRTIKKAVPENQLHKYKSDLIEGFNNLVVDLDDVEEVLNRPYFRNKALLALGKTEWADINWQDGSIASKKHLINSVRLLFTAFEDASLWCTQRKSLRDQGVPSYLVDCSDAHTWAANTQDKDRIGNCSTWLRASPTFAGLLHALSEFDHRVYVGPEPEAVARRRRAPDKIIERVQVHPVEDASERLFDYYLPLNQGLVAIIGNKGQGKSALLDCIARGGNSGRDAEFGFLNETRFLSPRNRTRQDYQARVSWADTSSRMVGLHEGHDRKSLERVEYLPQRLIERICASDPTSEQRGSFEEELTRVLFHHIPKAERQGATNLAELLTLKTSAVDQEFVDLRRRLRQQSGEYVRIEASAKDLVVGELKAQADDLANAGRLAEIDLLRAENELQELDRTSTDSEQLQADRARLDQLSLRRGQLVSVSAGATQDAAARARVLSETSSLVVELEGMQARVRDITSSLRSKLGAAAGEPLAELVVDHAGISRLSAIIEQQRIVDLQTIKAADQEDKELAAEQTAIEARLGQSDSQRAAVRRRLEQIKSRIRAINGSSDEPGTLAYINEQLKHAEELPKRLDEAKSAILQGVRDAHRLHKKRLETVIGLYAPAATFVGTSDLAKAAGVEFVAQLLPAPTWSRFSNELDGRKSADLVVYLETVLAGIALDNEDEVADAIECILDRLVRQRGATDGIARAMTEAFRMNVDAISYLLDLASLAWLRDQFSLTGANGSPLDQLSPGERGLILLLFYLVVDREDIPLLLDQPEENLDNEAVRRVLVPALRDARERRQVIMVTHNANLAVVGDADQIVHCEFEGGSFKVEAGSLAEAATGQYSLNVLEGARPAFENRRGKYDSLVPSGL